VQLVYNDNELELAKATSRSPQDSIKYSTCYNTPIKSDLLNLPGFKLLKNTIYVNRYSQQSKAQQSSEHKALKNDECSLSKQYDTSRLRSVGIRFGLTSQSRLEVHEAHAIKISSFVSFKFRTLHPDGLLFYASDANFNDFISVWLQDGFVNYAFDCGTGLMHVRSKQTYSDGRYHTVTISRDKQLGALIISNRYNSSVVETITDKSIGLSGSLSVIEPYYFGNIPAKFKEQIPAGQLDLISFESFIGCMSDFVIAHKTLRNNLEKIDLMSCSNNHESGLFFTGHSLTSYASYANYLSLSDVFEISFEFKSRTKSGVLLYLGNKQIQEKKDFLLVELVNGELHYKLNANGLENQAKFVPELVRNELCNASWVRVTLRKDADGLISLEMKGFEYKNVNEIYLPESTTPYTLHIGALPAREAYADLSESKEPFTGCVRDLSVKKNEEPTHKKLLLDMNLESGVLTYCPTN